MSQSERPPSARPNFELLYVELERPEAKVVMAETREVAEASSAIEELARFTSDCWIPFTTFCSS